MQIAGRLFLKNSAELKLFAASKREDDVNFPDPSKGRVILLSYRLNPTAQWFEFVIAFTLKLRGYAPVIVFGESASRYTDGYLCTTNRWRQRFPSMLRAASFAHTFGIETISIAKYLGRDTIRGLRSEAFQISGQDVANFTKYGVAIGKQVIASLCRYFLKGDVDPAKEQTMAREFLFTALVSIEAARVLSENLKPRLLISSHGIYASWGSFCEYFKKHSLPYVCWGLQYRNHAILACHNEGTRLQVVNENPANWESLDLTTDKKNRLMEYIKSKGSNNSVDSVNYYLNQEKVNSSSILDRLGIPDGKPVFALFPNLAWDAQVSFQPLFFRTMNEWIYETIRWFESNPDKTLIIRSHPAELRGQAETQDKVMDFIERKFVNLPENIIVILPDSDITSYMVLESADVCLIYGSKIGLEAAILGKPVIISVKSHFHGKGISFDPVSKEAYFKLLQAGPAGTPFTEKMAKSAIQYGYHYYFRRQYILPLANLKNRKFTNYAFSSVNSLKPGGIPELDTFIDNCFSGEPFIVDN